MDILACTFNAAAATATATCRVEAKKKTEERAGLTMNYALKIVWLACFLSFFLLLLLFDCKEKNTYVYEG